MHRSAVVCFCLILSIPLLFVDEIKADELTVAVGLQGDQATSRPVSGMTTKAVENTFGAPENASSPVGEPPITIWRYANYSVYFEFNHVIHTVLHKS